MPDRLPAPGRVLVTGATGFLGGYVVRGLRERGMEVRALVRRADAGLPADVETARADDLSDRAALSRACEGVDAVVHLAGRAHQMRENAPDPLAEFRRVNRDGTRTLLEAALQAGVSRFVYASSVKAVGEGGERCWDASTAAAPTDPYGISKLEAERLLHDTAGPAGMHAVALRLPLLYGAGVRANMLKLFRSVDRRMPLPLGGIRNRRSLAYAGNVVAAIETVLRAPGAAGGTFYASDDEDLSTPELVRRIGGALGRPARLVPVPGALFHAAGRVGDLIARVAPFPLTSAAVRRLTGSLCLDVSPLRALGWAPPFTVDQGLADAAAWYRSQHPARR